MNALWHSPGVQGIKYAIFYRHSTPLECGISLKVMTLCFSQTSVDFMLILRDAIWNLSCHLSI